MRQKTMLYIFFVLFISYGRGEINHINGLTSTLIDTIINQDSVNRKLEQIYLGHGINIKEEAQSGNNSIKFKDNCYYYSNSSDDLSKDSFKLEEILKEDTAYFIVPESTGGEDYLFDYIKYAINLKRLTVEGERNGNSSMQDISLLGTLKKLEVLKFNKIYNIDLHSMPFLSKLKCLVIQSYSSKSKNIDWLRNTPNLEALRILEEDAVTKADFGKIENISALSICKNLKIIELSKNRIKDINVLAKLPQLRKIDLSYNNIVDPRPLLKLKEVEINIDGNPINKVLLTKQQLEELKIE